MKEAAIKSAIMKYLRKAHPRSHFFRVAQGPFSVGGISDIIGCHNGRFVALEVKTPRNYPTPLQKVFIKLILRAGGLAGIVRSVEDTQLILEGE